MSTSPTPFRAIRVLRVISTLHPKVGGPSYSTVNQVLAEQSANISTTLVSTAGAGESQCPWPELAQGGVTHRAFRRASFLGALGERWGLSTRLAFWVLRNARHYDIVHVHYVWSLTTVAGIAAGAVWRVPVVMTPHESLTSFGIETSRSSLRRLQKLVARRFLLAGVDRVVIASQLELRDSGLDDRRGRVIPHPVRQAASRPSAPALGSSGWQIGFLGRLHPKKRINDLVDAFASLDDDSTLTIGGDQPRSEYELLRSRIATEGLDDKVRLLGFVDPAQREAFFSSLDVLVMPSAYECFGMVAAEALSAGVPVITTDRTGIADVVRRYDAGVVVGVAAPEEIRAAIRRIPRDRVEKAALRERAQRAARSALSFAAYAEAMRAVYDEVL